VELDYVTKKPKTDLNMIVSAYRIPVEDVRGEIKGGLLEIVKGKI
jgi:hypothetical protein